MAPTLVASRTALPPEGANFPRGGPSENSLMPKELLRIEGLHAWYGESHILHGVDLSVHEGEVVTLLGRNGAGRTTTLRAIVGLTGTRKGSIKINGVETIKLAPHKVAIQTSVAKVLGVGPDQVNVKAKTSEKMGPVGEGLAMEARAVVLIY